MGMSVCECVSVWVCEATAAFLNRVQLYLRVVDVSTVNMKLSLAAI